MKAAIFERICSFWFDTFWNLFLIFENSFSRRSGKTWLLWRVRLLHSTQLGSGTTPRQQFNIGKIGHMKLLLLVFSSSGASCSKLFIYRPQWSVSIALYQALKDFFAAHLFIYHLISRYLLPCSFKSWTKHEEIHCVFLAMSPIFNSNNRIVYKIHVNYWKF